MQKKIREPTSKVDYRLLYKRKVLDCLDELKNKDCTTGQMDAFMDKLFHLTDQVVPVCLEKLRENDEEFAPIACYALEYANDYSLVEPLLRILIMPGVSDKIKARILGVLAHYDIDASDLPLDIIMKDFEKMASDSLTEMLQDLERDFFTIAYILDDMSGFSVEMRVSYVSDIGKLKDERSIYLLEIIASTEDGPVALEAIKALGRMKTGKSLYSLMKLYNRIQDEDIKKAAEREIRKLKFSQVTAEEHSPPWIKLSKPYKIYVSSIDGLGSRALWMTWKNPARRGRLGFMNLILSCDLGIKDCWGASQISIKEFNASVKDFSKTTSIVECDLKYAVDLINDALAVNCQSGCEVPYQFYFWKALLDACAQIKPKSYTPVFGELDLEAIFSDGDLLKKTFKLFDYKFFKFWFIADPLVYDFAEKHKSRRGYVLKTMTWQRAEKLFAKFTEELVEPFADTIKRMLELSADFLCMLGEWELAKIAICAFLHMDVRPLHYHPFVQRMVIESLGVALNNMKNGFDMRVDPDAFI